MRRWGSIALVWLGSLALANLCANPFYPTDPSLRWRYRNLASQEVYTQSFSPLGPSALLERRQFANRSETLEWRCTPTGLQVLPAGEQPIPGGQVRIVRLVGVVIPAAEVWRVEGRWSYRYELRGRAAFFDLSGHLEVDNRIVAKEWVSVPAGRFEALRVEASFKGEFGIGFGGRATYWFAEGVGVVKQVSEGNFGGASLELLEFGRA